MIKADIITNFDSSVLVFLLVFREILELLDYQDLLEIKYVQYTFNFIDTKKLKMKLLSTMSFFLFRE